MRQQTVAKTSLVIKHLTGADIDATRAFLRKQCFLEGKGFSSQYAGQKTISCTTTAICEYALSETGPLTLQEKEEFQRILLAFRRNSPPDQAGAFPRSTGQTACVWTTGQAALALASLRAPWRVIQPSVEWLLRTQAANGGDFRGSRRSRATVTLGPGTSEIPDTPRRKVGGAATRNSALERSRSVTL